MTTDKSKNENPNALQLKIVAGYLLLTLLVLGIVAAVWYEKRIFRQAEAEERVMLEQRQLSNNTFKSLLSLFIDNERATLWDEADLQTYRHKEEKALGFIDGLRVFSSDPLQQARIDTVKALLEEKRKQLWQLAESPSPVRRVDSILASKLPAMAVPLTSRHPPVTDGRIPEKKKKGFLSWLKRKGKKEKPTAQHSIAENNVWQLRHEVTGALQSQEAYFAGLSDSLEMRNKILNRNINRLVNEFEADAMQRTLRRQEAVSELRERAFTLMCILSAVCLACVMLLYALIHKDVRRKYRYRQGLEESDRCNRELLMQRKKIMLTLAHDIRGPLNAINGSAELAAGIRKKRRRDGYLQNIRSSCAHILHLVNDLLDVYRLNEGKDTPNLLPFRLDGLLERITEEYGNLAHSKGLLFDKTLEGTEVTVKGDADRMEQIIYNLLSNAVKFTPSGCIRFAARHTDSTLQLEVSDTGIGMAKQDMERIFLPFERVAQHINADGFGLGLSITQSLVRLLGGTIHVESEPGQGSLFRISLPLPATGEMVSETNIFPIPPLAANLKVAAIDDDPMQLHIVREMLERSGVYCDTCVHVRELMAKIRETDYDLILTDIQMKDMGGFDLLTLLRSARIGNSHDVPVVAMTARGDTRQEVFAQAGFTGCIYKPFSMSELLQTVSRHAAQAGTPVQAEADFSSLTADMHDPVEVLDTFIRECRSDRMKLEKLIRQDNEAEIQEMMHRLLPLWEILEVESPLQELSGTLRDGTEEKMHEAAGRVLQHMDSLTEQAEKQKREIIHERNTNR